MANQAKYNQILDALQKILLRKNIQSVSVSEIALEAVVGKGSVYYYFPSKDAIYEALIERNYEKPLETARNLADQTGISPFTRMAMLFQACRNSSAEFLQEESSSDLSSVQEKAYIHQKYLTHLIQALKPQLARIIRQGIEGGEIHFDQPDALAEIVLIVLSVKLDNTLVPSSREEIESTIGGLVKLLEQGTGNPAGSLNFLTAL